MAYILPPVENALVYERQSASEDGHMCDDRQLRKAYDRALKIVNESLFATRGASSTNSQDGQHGKSKKNKLFKPKPCEDPQKWKVGMACRAVYEGDGLEYEAIILRTLNDHDCFVKFLGYENSELLFLSALKPSLGRGEQKMQIKQAIYDRMEKGSDRVISPKSAERTSQRKSSSKKNQPRLNEFQMQFSMQPEIVGWLKMLPPPPPPRQTFLESGRTEIEEQILASMMLSWYMCGYYAGIYQGLRRASANHGGVRELSAPPRRQRSRGRDQPGDQEWSSQSSSSGCSESSGPPRCRGCSRDLENHGDVRELRSPPPRALGGQRSPRDQAGDQAQSSSSGRTRCGSRHVCCHP